MQVLNFLYSVPQLFGMIPCPRHRMPNYEQATDLLCNSYAEFDPDELNAMGRLVLALCERFKLAHVIRTKRSKTVRMSNLTIINYALCLRGPTHEARLTLLLLQFQVVCNTLALLVRYRLAGVFYEVVR